MLQLLLIESCATISLIHGIDVAFVNCYSIHTYSLLYRIRFFVYEISVRHAAALTGAFSSLCSIPHIHYVIWNREMQGGMQYGGMN